MLAAMMRETFCSVLSFTAQEVSGSLSSAAFAMNRIVRSSEPSSSQISSTFVVAGLIVKPASISRVAFNSIFPGAGAVGSAPV